MQRRQAPAETTASSGAAGSKKKMAMAKGGLKSLAVALASPPLLTAATARLLGGPPAAALRLMAMSAALLLGLAAWLVWADRGFRRRPAAAALYGAAAALGLAWGPVVFGAGAARAGLAVCAGLVLALVGCARTFRQCNSVAGDLAKVCVAWACFLGLYNYRLLSN
ncbi:TSPO(outer membrane tryptophan-rich sensory protein)-like protein [Wolffia australiana]